MTIAHGWYEYAERVMPTESSQAEGREQRRAYYAGAAHLLESLLASNDDDSSPTLEQTLARIAALRIELSAFTDAVLDGQA
jgi:hypothetical protein